MAGIAESSTTPDVIRPAAEIDRRSATRRIVPLALFPGERSAALDAEDDDCLMNCLSTRWPNDLRTGYRLVPCTKAKPIPCEFEVSNEFGACIGRNM